MSRNYHEFTTSQAFCDETVISQSPRPCDRLKQVRKRLGKSQAELAALLELSVSGYRNYEKGERDIPPVVLARARDLICISPRWVQEGIGEIFVAPDHHESTTPGATVGVQEPAATALVEDFGERYRRAVAVVDGVLSATGFTPQRLLYEGLKTLAFANGVTSENLALLVHGVQQEIILARATAKLDDEPPTDPTDLDL